MGGSGSKETPATCAAAAALGEKRVALCHALFEKLAGKRYAVSAREFLADTLGVGRGLPDTHLGWLADSLAKRAGPDPHPPRHSHTNHHHHKHADADCESNSAEEDGHCAMTKRTFLMLISMLSSGDKMMRRKVFFGALAKPCIGSRNDADAASLETVLRVAAGADFADALDYMMWEALKKHGKDGALGDLETGIDEDRFDTFLDRCPLAEALLDELFIPIDGIAGLVEGPHFPERVRDGPRHIKLGPDAALSDTAATAIEWCLPRSKQGRWELLYSSNLDGASFQRMRQCAEDKGSTVIIIRDDGGHVFGAYASEPIKPCPAFYGSDDCFLFSAEPKLRVYRTSAVNSNYMYFNFMQQTLPNGLAFGGQLEYFGVQINEDFNTGRCRGHPLSSTYGNPVLSHADDFKVESLEIWRVGPIVKNQFSEDEDEEEEEEDDDDVSKQSSVVNRSGSGGGLRKKSILAKAKEDQTVLELAGKRLHSNDLRPPEEDEAPVVYRADGKVKRPVY